MVPAVGFVRHKDHAWSNGFVIDQAADDRSMPLLTLTDVARRLGHGGTPGRLSDRFVRRDVPCYIRCNNGPGFTMMAVCEKLQRVVVKRLFIQPGNLWEAPYPAPWRRSG